MQVDNICIRRLSPSDIQQITNIYNHYIVSTTATFEDEPVSEKEMLQRADFISTKYPYLVAVSGNELIGYAYVHQWKDKSAYSATAESTIYLSPGNYYNGVGTKLMNELISQCKKSGIHSLIACITAENTNSCKFHEKLGFKPVSYFKEVGLKFERLLDIVDYQLIIK
ncbi:MAG: GNAT family N-acetyltransferase [Paramuribaculum sp.]|nr:GNAT family N-acetyltransferase [Paramuribaculum sp.]